MNNDLALLVTNAAVTATFTKDPRRFKRMVHEIEERSGISRRAFLGGLMGTAAAVAAGVMLPTAVDAEKLLWTPGTTTLIPATRADPDTIIVDSLDWHIPLGTPEELELVTRHIGKKNFGSMWEPTDVKLSDMANFTPAQFRLVLQDAQFRFHSINR